MVFMTETLIFSGLFCLFLVLLAPLSKSLTKREWLWLGSGLMTVTIAHIIPYFLSFKPFVAHIAYGVVMWFISPPLLLLAFKRYLQQLYWHYRIRRLITLFASPGIARSIFFSLLFLYAMIDFTSLAALLVKLALNGSAYLLWWNMLIPSIFTNRLNEKQGILQITYQFVLTTCIAYILFLCKQPVVAEKELQAGIYLFLGGQAIVHLIFLAFFFSIWSKREHMVDPFHISRLFHRPRKGDKTSLNK